MKLSYGELIEELKCRSASELVDLEEMVKHYRIEQRRAEILQEFKESEKLLQEGRLPPPTDDVQELMRRLRED